MNPPNHDDYAHIYGQPPPRQVRRTFKVRPGMNVYSSDRRRVGLVDRLFLEHGRVTGILINHGLTQRRHKKLQVEVVDHLEAETVILELDQSAFLQMPDVDPNAV